MRAREGRSAHLAQVLETGIRQRSVPWSTHARWPRVAAGEAALDHLHECIGLDVDDVDRSVVPIGEVVASSGAVDSTDVEGEVAGGRDVRHRDERYDLDAATAARASASATAVAQGECRDQHHGENT